MRLAEAWRVAFDALRANRLRSVAFTAAKVKALLA